MSFELNISYSSAYIQKGEIPSSLNYIERARKTASIKDLAKVYQNLSIHYLYVSELDKAAAYCLQALELSGNIYEKSVLANNYAVILLEQGRYDSALAVCNRNLAYTSQTEKKWRFPRKPVCLLSCGNSRGKPDRPLRKSKHRKKISYWFIEI